MSTDLPFLPLLGPQGTTVVESDTTPPQTTQTAGPLVPAPPTLQAAAAVHHQRPTFEAPPMTSLVARLDIQKMLGGTTSDGAKGGTTSSNEAMENACAHPIRSSRRSMMIAAREESPECPTPPPPPPQQQPRRHSRRHSIQISPGNSGSFEHVPQGGMISPNTTDAVTDSVHARAALATTPPVLPSPNAESVLGSQNTSRRSSKFGNQTIEGFAYLPRGRRESAVVPGGGTDLAYDLPLPLHPQPPASASSGALIVQSDTQQQPNKKPSLYTRPFQQKQSIRPTSTFLMAMESDEHFHRNLIGRTALDEHVLMMSTFFEERRRIEATTGNGDMFDLLVAMATIEATSIMRQEEAAWNVNIVERHEHTLLVELTRGNVEACQENEAAFRNEIEFLWGQQRECWEVYRFFLQNMIQVWQAAVKTLHEGGIGGVLQEFTKSVRSILEEHRMARAALETQAFETMHAHEEECTTWWACLHQFWQVETQSILHPSFSLKPGCKKVSQNGRYFLSHQMDGNVVLYDRHEEEEGRARGHPDAIFGTGTNSEDGAASNSFRLLSSDEQPASLVLQTGTGHTLWRSSAGAGALDEGITHGRLTNNGKVVLCNANTVTTVVEDALTSATTEGAETSVGTTVVVDVSGNWTAFHTMCTLSVEEQRERHRLLGQVMQDNTTQWMAVVQGMEPLHRHALNAEQEEVFQTTIHEAFMADTRAIESARMLSACQEFGNKLGGEATILLNSIDLMCNASWEKSSRSDEYLQDSRNKLLLGTVQSQVLLMEEHRRQLLEEHQTQLRMVMNILRVRTHRTFGVPLSTKSNTASGSLLNDQLHRDLQEIELTETNCRMRLTFQSAQVYREELAPFLGMVKEHVWGWQCLYSEQEDAREVLYFTMDEEVAREDIMVEYRQACRVFSRCLFDVFTYEDTAPAIKNELHLPGQMGEKKTKPVPPLPQAAAATAPVAAAAPPTLLGPCVSLLEFMDLDELHTLLLE